MHSFYYLEYMNISKLLPQRIRGLIGNNRGPTLRAKITDVQIVSSSSRTVRLGFITPNGEESFADLEIANYAEDSEIYEFMNMSDAEADLRELFGQTVSVNISHFPQFYNACQNPPVGLMKDIANHPKAIQATDFTHSDLDNLSMEELLAKRFQSLSGISESDAHRMAKEEALQMGELDALEINESQLETKETVL